MIRCVRLWTGNDGNSHYDEGETKSGGSYEWHKDRAPRFVITLSGTLELETRGGEHFTKTEGDGPFLWHFADRGRSLHVQEPFRDRADSQNRGRELKVDKGTGSDGGRPLKPPAMCRKPCKPRCSRSAEQKARFR
jgi:hypothetical protein